MGLPTNDWTGKITGSAFCNTATVVTPPANKVIVAIHFIKDNAPTALVAEDPEMYMNTVVTAHEQGNAGSNDQDHGDGGLAVATITFGIGSTIYGRWTSVTPAASTGGGIICYFGE
tara:strand:+ start:113 stop:460 length:348 start_codon:yes stop_codon:yes gene_type:complete